MTRSALITGITGQDGSYLAEFLLERGYRVYGLVRRSSAGPNLRNIEHIKNDIAFIQGDMTDSDSLKRAVANARPDEIYNLAAQSFVPMSWSSPTYTMMVNAGGFLYLLEAIRQSGDTRQPRIYQASTSEMFGNAGIRGKDISESSIYLEKNILSLDENSPMRPRSPYGVSKLAAHRMAQVYRESFDMFVACGIFFNHESTRRGEMFVTRKITKAIARILLGKQDKLKLGCLDARRDWGFALDYVRAMWQMLQQPIAEDFVVGTGITHSVEDVVAYALAHACDIIGEEKDIAEFFNNHVVIDAPLKRPAEIWVLKANNAKARHVLGWKPAVNFDRLIRMMVAHDLKEETK